MNPHEAFLEGVRLSADIEASQRRLLTAEYIDRRAAEIERDLKVKPLQENQKIVEVGHLVFATEYSHLRAAEHHTFSGVKNDE